jgi:L-arabinose isomerase
MIQFKQYEIWFLTGSHKLYGDEALTQVDAHSTEIAAFFNTQQDIPVTIKHIPVMVSPEYITQVCKEANNSESCVGLITWMHTFSPAKMWIEGLSTLTKPILHLHTQFNRDIPFATIDMDFMNLNQSAHGDREYAHMLTRLGIKRKTVVGHWQDSKVVNKIGMWSRVAVAHHHMKKMKIVRFGDNMREVAVTEGDKVAAQMQFGFSVNYHAVGDLVAVINQVSNAAIQELIKEYEEAYTLAANLLASGNQRSSLIEAARIELGIKYFLTDGGYTAFSNTFQDLHGMRQLPGIGSQRMMAAGIGYAGEGDWKTAAMVRVLKVMGAGLPGGNSFMEDYTYHFDPNNPMVLGSHMLEICPTISSSKPSCEVHRLALTGKEDPVRLVFNGDAGPAINVSLVDMGDKFRLIVNEVEGLAVNEALPKLPTPRVFWRPYPSMEEGLAQWLEAGGAHHTVYSQNIKTEQIKDLANMMNVELITIA